MLSGVQTLAQCPFHQSRIWLVFWPPGASSCWFPNPLSGAGVLESGRKRLPRGDNDTLARETAVPWEMGTQEPDSHFSSSAQCPALWVTRPGKIKALRLIGEPTPGLALFIPNSSALGSCQWLKQEKKGMANMPVWLAAVQTGPGEMEAAFWACLLGHQPQRAVHKQLGAVLAAAVARKWSKVDCTIKAWKSGSKNNTWTKPLRTFVSIRSFFRACDSVDNFRIVQPGPLTGYLSPPMQPEFRKCQRMYYIVVRKH